MSLVIFLEIFLNLIEVDRAQKNCVIVRFVSDKWLKKMLLSIAAKN